MFSYLLLSCFTLLFTVCHISPLNDLYRYSPALFGWGINWPFLLSIPRLALRAGYEQALSSLHTPTSLPGGVSAGHILSPYPGFPSGRGIGKSYLLHIPRLPFRVGDSRQNTSPKGVYIFKSNFQLTGTKHSPAFPAGSRSLSAVLPLRTDILLQRCVFSREGFCPVYIHQ